MKKTSPRFVHRAFGAFLPLVLPRSFPGLMVLVFSFALLAPAASRAQLAFSPVVTPYGGNGQVKAATGNGYMFSPSVVAFEAPNGSGGILKKILLSWGNGADVPGAGGLEPLYHRAISTDGGKTFGATVTTNPEYAIGLAFKKRDGSMIYPTWHPVYPTLPTTSFVCHYLTSTDHGVTWTARSDGSYNTSPLSVNGMRFNGIYLETSSALYGTAYTWVNGDVGVARSIVMKSTNGGVNWTYVGTLAGTGASNFDESTFTWSKDGSKWIGMVRQGNWLPIKYTYSTNQGVSWSTPVIPPGFPTGVNAAYRSDTGNNCINPHVWMIPNGVMLVSFGRPHSRFALNLDGNGVNWSNITITIPEELPDCFPDTLGAHTSGNTMPVDVAANRFMLFGDTGANWSYHTYTGPNCHSGTIIDHPSPNPFSIRAHVVDVVLANKVNRIDLKGKYLADPTIVSSDMTYTPNATMIPESRESGAFDGSIRYRSGAFKNATSGTFTIDLKKDYVINGLGVCLFYDTTESATIDVATESNPTTWINLANYTSVKHYALDYPAITTRTARYVRVSLSSPGPLVCLNEIELYTTSDSFEHNTLGTAGNPHGVVPPGYVVNGTSATQYGFAVRDTGTSAAGYQSERSFQMWDGSSIWRAGIKKTVAATASKTLEFRIKPLAYDTTIPDTGCIQFLLNSGASAVYQLAIFPDGSIKWYDGTAPWNNLAPAGTVPLNVWSLIKVQATITPATAAVTVNGTSVGSAGKNATSPTTMDGFSFGSGGTAPTGDNALFDDITIN